MITVAVAGKFDPIHKGHFDHIQKASRLGDYLYVITHPDDVVAKSSAKGFCVQDLDVRRQVLQGLLLLWGINGMVVTSIDGDGGCDQTLKMLKPTYFAKGGDRTPDNMPQDEIDTCKEIGCKIVYGIGDLLNSSSKIARGPGGCQGISCDECHWPC